MHINRLCTLDRIHPVVKDYKEVHSVINKISSSCQNDFYLLIKYLSTFFIIIKSVIIISLLIDAS